MKYSSQMYGTLLCINLAFHIRVYASEYGAKDAQTIANNQSSILSLLKNNPTAATCQIIEHLIQHNGDINYKDSEGNTPLKIAVISDAVESKIVKYLVDNNALLPEPTQSNQSFVGMLMMQYATANNPPLNKQNH